MNRRRPPIDLIKAAEQDYQEKLQDLARLVSAAQELLGRWSEVETATDVWLTLLCHDQRVAAFIGATAIVQLAKAERPAGNEPGS